MPDFANVTLPVLTEKSRKKLGESTQFVMPSYDGFGLSNLTPSVSRWLGGPKLISQTFSPSIMEMFSGRYKRVVLLLVDALGYNQLVRLIENSKAPFWLSMLKKGSLFPITSVSPSTTATALTSIWTGVDPLRHGIIGYEMWVKELSMVINTILHMPSSYAGDIGSLVKAGFDPTSFLNNQPFGAYLDAFGIESHSYLPYSITGSGLSQMHSAKTNLHGYVSESDLWANLRDNLNSRPATPKFVYAYWPLVDTLMHRYGPDDDRVTCQFDLMSQALQTQLFDRLENWAKKDTLFVLTADHGSVFTPPYENNVLSGHPDLLVNLVMLPTCENRLPFLYIKPDKVAEVREYFDHTWPGMFSLITRQQALNLQLFGIGEANPKLDGRIADLIAISHEDAYLWWANKPNLMLGRHGGLSADEMLVPLFGIELG
jgi:hypothetical protein